MGYDDKKELSESISKIKVFCKAIYIICLICLVLFTVIWMFSLGLMVYDYTTKALSTINTGDIAYLFLFGILVITLLVVAQRIFSDLLTGKTPFSMSQVKRLRIMGTALVVYATVEVFLSASFHFVTDIAGQHSGVIASGSSSSAFIHVNLTAIVAALACYGLALIFKYGILLQELSDDTL